MNVGIRKALESGAHAVLLVNSDAIVPPDCIASLERCLARTNVGIAGPALRSRSDPGQLTSLGMRYTAATGRMRHIAAHTRVALTEQLASEPVAAVSGCVMLVRREVFESVGLFDEDYFFSFEDLDFCLRARRAGFVTMLAGTAVAYHEGGRSIGQRSPQRLYFAARNHLLMARRDSKAAGHAAPVWRSTFIVGLNLAHALISDGGSLRSRVTAVSRGARDYLAGRYGDDRESSVTRR
jgi:GT2 family glycosyltransferase